MSASMWFDRRHTCSWENPPTDSEMHTVMDAALGRDGLPVYAWYGLGSKSDLNQLDKEVLVATFFRDSRAGWGDIELHRHPHEEGEKLLRIRNSRVRVARIELPDGHICHLLGSEGRQAPR